MLSHKKERKEKTRRKKKKGILIKKGEGKEQEKIIRKNNLEPHL